MNALRLAVLPAALAAISACAPCAVSEVAHITPLAAQAGALYTAVAAKEGVAYVGTASHGTVVVDLLTKAEVVRLDEGHQVRSLAAGGNYLAVALETGIAVYDVTDGKAPSQRVAFASPDLVQCRSLFIHGDVVYCATGLERGAHLVMVQLSSASGSLAAQEVGSYSLPATQQELDASFISVRGVYVEDRGAQTLAYLASAERGLQILDVTDPANPVLLGGAGYLAWSDSVWVSGDYAYVAEGNYKGLIRIWDVSTPSNPRPVGALQSKRGEAFCPQKAQVFGGNVFASWFQDGLRVFETRETQRSDELALFNTWDETDNRTNPAEETALHAGAADVFVDASGQIYVVDAQTGLWVLKFDPKGGSCFDANSGVSAYTKVQAPLGFGPSLPTAIRRNRTLPIQVPVRSVDYFFPMAQAAVDAAAPSIELTGAEVLGGVVPGPYAIAHNEAWIQRSYRIGSAVPVGSADLHVMMNDGTVSRHLQTTVSILDQATPNTDTEPNDDYGTSPLIVPGVAGAATFTGSLGGQDAFDFYRLERSLGQGAFELRIAVPAKTGAPDVPAILAALNTSGSATQNTATLSVVPFADVTLPQYQYEIVLDASAADAIFNLALTLDDWQATLVPYQVRLIAM